MSAVDYDLLLIRNMARNFTAKLKVAGKGRRKELAMFI